MKRFSIVLIAIAIGIAIIVLPLCHIVKYGDYARVSQVRVEERGGSTAYIADVYVNGKVVRRIYIEVLRPLPPKVYGRIRIHIPIVEKSELKSLEIVFKPSLGGIAHFAWIPTSIDKPIEFHINGATTIWKCQDLGFYGVGTLTLDFIPYIAKSENLKGISIHIEAIIEYNRVEYQIKHMITI